MGYDPAVLRKRFFRPKGLDELFGQAREAGRENSAVVLILLVLVVLLILLLLLVVLLLLILLVLAVLIVLLVLAVEIHGFIPP